MNPIERAVLTSSSDQLLTRLMRQVMRIDDVHRFELLMLRDIDIWEIEQQGRRLEPEQSLISFQDRKPTDIMAVNANQELLYQWIVDCFDKVNDGIPPEEPRCVLSGFATFFPDITSLTQEPAAHCNELRGMTPRQIAVRALVNTLRLAQRIKALRPDLLAKSCGGRKAIIVEAVCGTVTDRCCCKKCIELQRVNEVDFGTLATPERKIEILCESLGEVQQAFDPVGDTGHDWTIALEAEPGPAYLLKNGERIRQVLDAIKNVQSKNGHRLADHVGLNVDIAHMRIAGVKVEQDVKKPGESLRDHIGRIVHSHICDNPKMHTRDQPIGSWHSAEYDAEEWMPFLNLLSDAASHVDKREYNLPFSGAVSLELEGCDRLRWIHQSLSDLKYLLYDGTPS